MFYVWEASSCRSLYTFVFYAPHITSEKIHDTKGFNPPPTAWNDFKDSQAKNTIPAHLLNKSLIFQIKSHLACRVQKQCSPVFRLVSFVFQFNSSCMLVHCWHCVGQCSALDQTKMCISYKHFGHQRVNTEFSQLLTLLFVVPTWSPKVSPPPGQILLHGMSQLMHKCP